MCGTDRRPPAYGVVDLTTFLCNVARQVFNYCLNIPARSSGGRPLQAPPSHLRFMFEVDVLFN
jgi:hypothetical protein